MSAGMLTLPAPIQEAAKRSWLNTAEEQMKSHLHNHRMLQMGTRMIVEVSK
jgi:hypothetical protein